VRAPSQVYGEDLNGNYDKDGRRGAPFSLRDNKEENHYLLRKKDLQRLMEITPTEKSACLEAYMAAPSPRSGAVD
jgi:hypothetical protein